MSHPACSRQISFVRIVLTSGALATAAGGCHLSNPDVTVEPADSAMVDVGYDSQPRREVTGAIESAGAKELSERKVSHAEELLEAEFAGLDVLRLPNGDFRLRIRGGLGEPLVVVDGIPSPPGVPNPLRDIPPGRIAGVSILKDAGATAAYGSRGANGVILITLHRGR